ncbi:hypothetical protein vBBceSLY5_0036 [Bacillus phage vB_BceS_LY5]|uniref:hypothetical protein n=1 Tax=Bacillus phage vB_BceS_LY5 TaxID=2996058 RepID=UPI004054E364|nr:hypothetical protein vBBceSLY5_0036 [Bacillus phage vB_BceS_LY5]
MLNIQVTERYKLTSSEDGKNIMIEKQIYKEDDIGLLEPTGKYKVDGYFGRNIKYAMKGLIQRVISDSNATSFDALIMEMEAIEKRIIDLVSNLDIEHMLDSE